MASAIEPFRPGAAGVATSQVEISVSGRNLMDTDVFSKSDPMCVMYMQDAGSSRYREVGRTEAIMNTLNPDFVHKFIVPYHFEEVQKVKFELYDIDSESHMLEKHDYLGEVETTLGEMVAFQGSQFKKPITMRGVHTGKCGYIIVVVQELGRCKEVAKLQFLGHKLDRKDWFGKSDPFLIFYRINEDQSLTAVHRTEVIKRTLNPVWKPFSIRLQTLCKGDHGQPFVVECYDWNYNGSHNLIGEFQTCMNLLKEGPGPANEYPCINKKKKERKRNYKNSGVIKLMMIEIEEEQTFLDYITGGLQLHFTVAIDFTSSNGDPKDPNSLHFQGSARPNAYATAIKAVGEIIQDYDHDKLFPALGFGARIPPKGEVSHEFFLNGNPDNPFCYGIDGILEAYYRSLFSVQLYGPTNFTPVINHVARFAKAYQDGSHYFILLIITDGIITDMQQTKRAIINASKLPMSIIIIGVGKADFQAMEELDSDDVRLNIDGLYADRDIVQFVALRDYISGSNWTQNQAILAREVLAEVPDQVVGYMRSRGIRARPPPPQNGASRPSASASFASSTQQMATSNGSTAPPATAPPPWNGNTPISIAAPSWHVPLASNN